MSLFEMDTGEVLDPGSFHPLTLYEGIQEDYSAFSLSTHGHPMQEIRKSLSSFPKKDSKQLRSLRHGTAVEIGGLVLIRQKPPTAKGCMFSTLEDEYGFTDLIFHPQVYEKNREIILNHCFIIVKGKLQRDAHSISVLVERVRPIWKEDFTEERLTIEPTQYFHS
jgi:error-prone DNA polymerase